MVFIQWQWYNLHSNETMVDRAGSNLTVPMVLLLACSGVLLPCFSVVDVCVCVHGSEALPNDMS